MKPGGRAAAAAILVGLAIAAAAVVGWFQRPRDVVTVLLWFAGAIVLHDLVVLPLYSLLDRVVLGARRVREAGFPIVYVRIPAVLSALLLIVFSPGILGLGAATARGASGIAEHGYGVRWLVASGVIFALSGLVYALRTLSARSAPAAPRRRAAGPA